MKRIRYYISGHGLGHASRSCHIINTLRRRHPEVTVEVVSSAHPWFFETVLDPSVPVFRRDLDVGVLQEDSLLMREEETFEACRTLLAGRDAFAEEEGALLAERRISLVVCDIPHLPFAAAARAGVFSVGISNFSWDWIYEGISARHPGYDDVIEEVRRDYARADLLLRLPFHGEFPSFSAIEDLPLVARHAVSSRDEVRQGLEIPRDAKIGLVSFGGFGLSMADFAPLEALRGWIFLAEPEMAIPGALPLNLKIVPRGLFPYPDLVRASDVVITKPGYGIVSEAIANETPVLYTPRGEFPEQPLLVAALHRYTRAREIGNDALRRGAWGESLEVLLAAPHPLETLPSSGDVVAADRLAELA